MIGFNAKTHLLIILTFITSLILLSNEAGYANSNELNDASEGSIADGVARTSSTIVALELATSTPKIIYLPAILASPISEPEPDPVPSPSPNPSWLTYLNHFRDQAKVPHLSEFEEWTNGATLHSRYMVKNNYITHYENPSNGWYTQEGYDAGRNGNVFVSSWHETTDEMAINFWMMGPFHAISMLDPQLEMTALGTYREDGGGWEMGATLDVLRGRGALPPGTTFPLPFPLDGGHAWLRQYTGNEWPDPLTSCPGYSAPSGPPIMVQIGDGSLTPNVTDYQFSTGGAILPACIFDETSYFNPDGGTQYIGRSVLNSRDAIVIMPKDPLVAGQEYFVSVTNDGQKIEWGFSVTSAPTITSPAPSFTFEMR